MWLKSGGRNDVFYDETLLSDEETLSDEEKNIKHDGNVQRGRKK